MNESTPDKSQSHPVRVRGLKSRKNKNISQKKIVAPRAGAWIEIKINLMFWSKGLVAPRAGAWIEIVEMLASYACCSSRTPCGCVD